MESLGRRIDMGELPVLSDSDVKRACAFARIGDDVPITNMSYTSPRSNCTTSRSSRSCRTGSTRHTIPVKSRSGCSA